VRDLHRLDRELVPGRVQRRHRQLRAPRVVDVPSADLGPCLVDEDDRHVLTLDLPVHRALPPLPDVGVVADAPFERDVRVLDQSRQLLDRHRVSALAVIDRVVGDVEAGALAEPRSLNAADLDSEIVGAIRVDARSGGHGDLPFPYPGTGPVTATPRASRTMWTTTNS